VKKEPKMPDDTRDRDRHHASSHETDHNILSRRNMLLGSSALVAAATLTSGALAQAQKAAPAATGPSGRKPNILFIMGDDIGWFNVSAYNMGIMGYRTPNIDRIGREGAIFTDWYGQQSCTAGRAAFITGQSPIRTGLTKVGLPGAELGLGPLDPSVADVMKSQGYAHRAVRQESSRRSQ
jgi:Sulfatase